MAETNATLFPVIRIRVVAELFVSFVSLQNPCQSAVTRTTYSPSGSPVMSMAWSGRLEGRCRPIRRRARGRCSWRWAGRCRTTSRWRRPGGPGGPAAVGTRCCPGWCCPRSRSRLLPSLELGARGVEQLVAVEVPDVPVVVTVPGVVERRAGVRQRGRGAVVVLDHLASHPVHGRGAGAGPPDLERARAHVRGDRRELQQLLATRGGDEEPCLPDGSCEAERSSLWTRTSGYSGLPVPPPGGGGGGGGGGGSAPSVSSLAVMPTRA